MSFRSWLLIFVSCTLATFPTSNLSAQQSKVSAPHRPVPPEIPWNGKTHNSPALRSQVGGFWMVDANFKSSVRIKNFLEISPLTITPILWLSNGKSLALAPITLEPAGVATISVNKALEDNGIASWATLYGYVEIQYTWAWDAICVTLQSLDVAHSLIFTSGLGSSDPVAPGSPATKTSSQSIEGMWWKQEPNVTGFIALSNPTALPLRAIVRISDDQQHAQIGQHAVTVSPHGTKRLDLPELFGTIGSVGGVQIAYEGPKSGFLVTGALEDEAVGYSATIPFLSLHLEKITRPVTMG